MSPITGYRCSPTIVWVKDANQILLVNQKTDHSRFLRDVEATVWDWLILGYSYAKITQMLALMLNISEDAGPVLESVLHDWLAAGIIQVCE
jgi:hypothetical protein